MSRPLDRNGFVFSLDGAFAVIVLIGFLATFMYFSNQVRHDNYEVYALQKVADDALIVLSETGCLHSLSQENISNTLNRMLNNRYDWSIQINVYTGNPHLSGFESATNMSFGSSYQNVQKIVTSKTVFPVLNDTTGRIIYYGIARLKLWMK